MRLTLILAHAFLFCCAGLLAYFIVLIALYGQVTLVEPRRWLALVEIGLLLGIMAQAMYLLVRQRI